MSCISGPDDQAWGERREAEFNEEDFESAIKGAECHRLRITPDFMERDQCASS